MDNFSNLTLHKTTLKSHILHFSVCCIIFFQQYFSQSPPGIIQLTVSGLQFILAWTYSSHCMSWRFFRVQPCKAGCWIFGISPLFPAVRWGAPPGGKLSTKHSRHVPGAGACSGGPLAPILALLCRGSPGGLHRSRRQNGAPQMHVHRGPRGAESHTGSGTVFPGSWGPQNHGRHRWMALRER